MEKSTIFCKEKNLNYKTIHRMKIIGERILKQHLRSHAFS